MLEYRLPGASCRPRSRRLGLGGARLRRPLRRSARSDRVAGAAGTRHDLNCVPRYIEIPYLKSSLASLYCDGGNLYHVNADLSISGTPPSGFAAVLSHIEHKPLLI